MELEQEGLNDSAHGAILHVALGPRSETPLFTDLLAGLKAKGYQQIVCFLSGVKPDSSTLEAMGIGVIYLGFNKKDLKKIQLSAIKKIKQIILENKINIVHGQRHKPSLYGTLAAWWAGPNVRVVTTVHGRNRTRNFKRKLSNKFIFSRTDHIFGVSQAVCRDILLTNKGLPADKVRCIYNGIDTEKFIQPGISRKSMRQHLGINGDKAKVIGTVGRLTPVKGHEYLVNAFAELSKKYEQLYLVIWGEGEQRERLEQVIEQKKLTDRVMLPGFSDDISSCLHALDVFVMSSLSEGHPLALLEAMAAGLPVVATAVGGIPEIITSKKEGLLIAAKDTAELITAIDTQLNASSQEKIENAKALQLKVKELYSINKMVDKTAGYYAKILQSEVSG